MRRMVSLVLLALIAVARAGNATELKRPGSGAVTAVSVAPAGDRAEVRIVVDGNIDVRDFILSSPQRIVLDFTGARLGMSPMMYDRLARGGITNIRFGQNTETVVRVVLELDAAREYTVVRGEGEVRILVSGGPGNFPAWEVSGAAPALAPALAPSLPPLTSPAVTQVAAGLVPPGRGVREPPPARATSTSSSAPSSAWGVSTAPSARQSQQPRMSVSYYETDIRDVIAGIAAFSGRTILVGRAVTGQVTGDIQDQPWDVALQAILRTHGLAAIEDPVTGIILVDSHQNILAQQSSEPLRTAIVPVNYSRAGALAQTIRLLLARDCPAVAAAGGGQQQQGQPGVPGQQPGCITRGTVAADSTTNSLIISEVESRLPDLLAYVSDLDIRTPQVQIKTKIILVNRTNIEEMGISYDFGTDRTFFTRLLAKPDPDDFQPIIVDGIPVGTGPGENFEGDARVEIGGNTLAAIANASARIANPALSLIFTTALGRFNLTTFLDALQTVQLADVQAVPSVTTLDNHEAEIIVGEEKPFPVAQGVAIGGGAVPPPTVQFKEVGIKLRVTPHVTNDRMINMTIYAERSGVQDQATDIGFTVSKQAAATQLLVADGETAVIGGLTITEVGVSKSGIPYLVDLPYVGRLFGTTRTREDKRDLLILVTPHIVDEGQAVGSRTGGR